MSFRLPLFGGQRSLCLSIVKRAKQPLIKRMGNPGIPSIMDVLHLTANLIKALLPWRQFVTLDSGVSRSRAALFLSMLQIMRAILWPAHRSHKNNGIRIFFILNYNSSYSEQLLTKIFFRQCSNIDKLTLWPAINKTINFMYKTMD